MQNVIVRHLTGSNLRVSQHLFKVKYLLKSRQIRDKKHIISAKKLPLVFENAKNAVYLLPTAKKADLVFMGLFINDVFLGGGGKPKNDEHYIK